MKLKWYTILAIGMLLGALLIMTIDIYRTNVFNNLIVDQWYDIGYQQGWCDGARETNNVTVELLSCYDGFFEIFGSVNETRWDVKCHTNIFPDYMEVGYKMSECRRYLDGNRS